MAGGEACKSCPTDLDTFFAWDNWLLDFGTGDTMGLGRVTLLAPRHGNPTDRHQLSTIWLALPDLTGSYRRFTPIAETPPAWSGSSLNLSAIGRTCDLQGLTPPSRPVPVTEMFDPDTIGRLRETASIVFYTRSIHRLAGRKHMYAPQAICLSYKKEGRLDFADFGEVLNPFGIRGAAIDLYSINDSRHVLSAWRDPFVFFEDGTYHMLFAGRYSPSFYATLPEKVQGQHRASSPRLVPCLGFDQEVNSSIGYAISTDLTNWTLRSPLCLPATASQFEVPTITKYRHSFVLTIVVSNGTVAIDRPSEALSLFGPRRQYLLAYRLQGQLQDIVRPNVWAAVQGFHDRFVHPLEKVYGVNVKQIGGTVYATGYDTRNLRLAPIVCLSPQGFPENLPSDSSSVWAAASINSSTGAAWSDRQRERGAGGAGPKRPACPRSDAEDIGT